MTIEWIRALTGLAPPATVAARQVTCDACPFKCGRWCKDCGCFLPAKQRAARASCRLWKSTAPAGDKV